MKPNFLLKKAVFLNFFSWEFWIPLLLLILLLAKNPFSDRSLIPNFEPYPDTFHYLVPPRCFLETGKWLLCRPNAAGITPDVPPLYSIIQIPFLLIYNDPRMFYFANVTLAIGSFFLLFKLLVKLNVDKLIIFSALLLTSVSYHFSWYPTLAMAENLIVFVFLLSLYVLLIARNGYTIVIGLALAVCFYATKYAFAPLTATFYLLHTLKIWKYRESLPRWLPSLILTLSIVALVVLLRTITTSSLFSANYFSMQPLAEEVAQKTWFSLAFLPKHAFKYLQALFGVPILVLWDIRPFFPPILSWLGVLGLALGLFKGRYRLVSAAILLGIVSQIAFISSFYAFDGRYIYPVVLALVIGFSIFLQIILSFQRHHRLFWCLFSLVFFIYLVSQTSRLKTLLAINFKYAESPWYYLATKKIDAVIQDKNDSNPVVITALPVFLFDFFASEDYQLLPLAPEQEAEKKSKLYGTNYNFDDLPKLYQQELNQGKSLYISNYGLGNNAYMHEAYARVSTNFKLTLISEGCYGACNVYAVHLQNK